MSAPVSATERSSIRTRVPSAPSADDADRQYAAANALAARLAAGDASVPLVVRLAQKYLQLGLGAAAGDLLNAWACPGADVAGSLTELTRVIPGGQGRQSWAALQSRFNANLAAWAARGGAAELVAQAWRADRTKYALFGDIFGCNQVRAADGHATTWLPCLGDHARLAELAPLPPDAREHMPGPYLFEGIDLGWYFSRVWRRTHNTFWGYSSALYVVEPDPALIALTFHLHDWRGLLADERVFVFVGPDSTQQLQTALRDRPALGLPRQVYQLSTHRPPPRPVAIDVVKAVLSLRHERVKAGAAELARQYADRDAAYWSERFESAMRGDSPPLRLLGVVSSHTSFLQYSMRDAQAAAQRLGHEFRVLTEERPYDKPGLESYHAAIAEFDPDLFVMIDHVRAEWGDALPPNLPVLTWDQDALPHVFLPDHIRGMGRLDVVVGLPKISCLARMGANPHQFLAVPMPTNPAQWDGAVLSDADVAAHAADLAYVSHGAATPQEMLRADLADCQDETLSRLMTAMFDVLMESIPPHQAPDGAGLRQVLGQAELRVGVRVNNRRLRERLFGWHLWRMWDRRFRHEILGWAGRYAAANGRRLRLYGAGWERHPSLAPFACGAANNGAELLAIYRAAAINLQIMPAGFLHQRALDGLAAGAFFLTPALDSDVCTPGLREMAGEIEQHGWKCAAELEAQAPPALRQEFQRVLAQIGFYPDENEEGFHHIRSYADWMYPQEAFGDFPAIVFRSEAEFAERADHFLSNAEERRAIATRMQAVVRERMSYDAAMNRFLSFTAGYYRSLAARQPVPMETCA